jgi:hypothetical protein
MSLSGDYVIEPPQQADAAGIAHCFLQVYGHDYVHPEVFSPLLYWDKVVDGELIPVVARDSCGQVVGHVALERGPGTKVAERGEAVVLAEHRGHGLLERMTQRLWERALEHHLEGVYAEPLTIHTFSQRNDEHAGMPVCAALLGVNPESFGPKDLSGPRLGQRQSYLRTFRFLSKPAPRTIYVPRYYQDVVMELYAALGAAVASALPNGPHVQESKITVTVNDRGHAVISFEAIGAGAGAELRRAFHGVHASGAMSLQLSVRLDDPGLPELCGTARNLGFFFSGLGPAFAEGADTLSLQWLGEPLDTDKLQLFSDGAKRLIAFIDRDRIKAAALA